jgi:ligand-binding sensor domain-containing protein
VKPTITAHTSIVGVIFLRMADGLYTFDLKTGKAVKVMSSGFDGIAPYVSFYTPGTTT